MNEKRILALIDAYGGNPARWPEAERDDALAALRISSRAQQALAEAQLTDKALDQYPQPSIDYHLARRIFHAAITRPQTRLRSAKQNIEHAGLWRWLVPQITGLAAAAFAGFLFAAPVSAGGDEDWDVDTAVLLPDAGQTVEDWSL